MITTLLTTNNFEAFKSYCTQYQHAHDESFLSQEELDIFTIGESNPTILLINDSNIIGVLSLMMDDYYLQANKSRIRIFHCESTLKSHYELLLNAILPTLNQLDHLELFLPNHLKSTQSILKELGFIYYRTSYLMTRTKKPHVKPSFPTGFTLRPFESHQDTLDYMTVRNAAFENIAGSSTPLTLEMVTKQFKESYLLPEGMQILRHHKEPVGVIRVLQEEDETGEYCFIAPIALIQDYQSKGLGTELLKAGIEIGQNNGYPDCMLVVNAENIQALDFYRKSGFDIIEDINCYHYPL